MPKGKAFDWLKRRADIPQGMFSTLEDLIEAAPQERMTAKQWKEYLAPGRILEREGVKFPLKKEEIDYTISDWLNGLDDRSGGAMIEKSGLLDLVQRQRPDIRQTPTGGGSNYTEYSTQGPRRYGYFESLTSSPDFGNFPTHFDEHTLSWHRGSRHALGPDPRTFVDMFPDPKTGVMPGTGVLRLIDEIQSDRHSAAAEKVEDPRGFREFLTPEEEATFRSLAHGQPGEAEFLQAEQLRDLANSRRPPQTRRGYRTPEQEERYLRLNGTTDVRTDFDHISAQDPNYSELMELKKIPPDAPFKSPADYGRLELKRGILDAIRQGDQYVGVTPSEGPINWFGFETDYDPGSSLNPRITGSQYVYDKVYPGELRKLAQQYGAPFREIDVPVNRKGSGTLREIVETESEDLPDYLMMAHEFEPEQYRILIDNLISGYRRDLPRTAEVKNALNRAQAELNRVSVGADSPDYVLPDTRDLEFAIYRLDELYDRHKPTTQNTAKVPSMELTPEVVERIKKAGIPLWAITGGIVGLDALSGDPAEGPAFAKGGRVRRVKDTIASLVDSSRDSSAYQKDPKLLEHRVAMNSPEYLELLRDWKPRPQDWDDLEGYSELAGNLDSGLIRRLSLDLPEDMETWRGIANLDDVNDFVPKWPYDQSTAMDRRIAEAFGQEDQYGNSGQSGILLRILGGDKNRVVPNPLGEGDEFVIPRNKELQIMKKKGSTLDVKRLKKARGGPVYSVGGAVDTEHMNDTDENGVPDDLQSYVGDVLSALTPSTMTGGGTLRKIAELPGSTDGIERRKQLMVGMLSQLYGLDLEGNATPLGYDSRRSSATPANRMSGILSKLRPGAADETLALPHYFNFIPGIDNDVSENSANRQEYLEQVIRDQLGIPDQPDEWDEELAYNLGIMLGQFPVAPGSAAKTAATKVAPGILRGIGRGAKKVGSAALEFFSPVISPKAGNYAAGTAFGTGMMTGGRKLGELLEDEEEEQPSPGYAEGGQIDINSLLGISSRDNSPTAQATKYVGSPMSYEEARTYGQGPERKFFEHNSAPLNIDFSKTQPAAGGGGAGGTGGGSGGNNLAGVLGSLPIVWDGLGKADSLLNTNLQGSLKDLGTGILTKLGLGSGAAAGGSSLAGLGALEIAPNAATSLPASLGGTGAATGAGTAATAGTGAAAGTGAGLAPGAGAGIAQVAVPAAIAYAAYKVLPQFVNSFKKDPAKVQGSYNADTGQLEVGFDEFTNQYMDRFGLSPDDVLGRLSPILDQYVTATQGGEKWGDKEMLNWAMQQGLVSKPQDYLDPYDRILKQKGRKKYEQWMSSADKDSALDMLTYQLLAENNGLWYGKGDIMHALKQAYGLE